MSHSFLQERITATAALIVAYEDAALAFAENGALQTYSIDSGQTKTLVTRAGIESMNRTLDSLYNRHQMLLVRMHGGAVTHGVPGF